MSQAPWLVKPEPLYRILPDTGPELEDELNAIAQDGYRIVCVLPCDGETVTRIILERMETISLTEQGDQALSEHLSI